MASWSIPPSISARADPGRQPRSAPRRWHLDPVQRPRDPCLDRTGRGRPRPTEPVSMAQAELNDGQTLFAFNDLFVGARTHVSARYRLDYAGQAEAQSSSGLIVSTGAGCTGWLQSVVTGAARVVGDWASLAPTRPHRRAIAWDGLRRALLLRPRAVHQPDLSSQPGVRKDRAERTSRGRISHARRWGHLQRRHRSRLPEFQFRFDRDIGWRSARLASSFEIEGLSLNPQIRLPLYTAAGAKGEAGGRLAYSEDV